MPLNRFLVFTTFLCAAAASIPAKPPITLDEFFNATELGGSALSRDGKAAVIATVRPDWKNDRFREDLWIWREGMALVEPLTQSGRDTEPRWSPDGKYVAFFSSRPLADEDAQEAKTETEKEIQRVWIIAASGGEAIPLYTERLKAHAFSWSASGTAVLFSVTQPRTRPDEEALKKEWKDVVRWREQERGDLLLEIPLQDAESARTLPGPHAEPRKLVVTTAPDKKAQQAIEDDTQPLPPHARVVSKSALAINEIAASPTGGNIAFLTNSISGRFEHPEAIEIYLADENPAQSSSPKQLTHNEAIEQKIAWSADGKTIYFGVSAGGGSVEGKYRDLQGKLYALDPATGKLTPQAKSFSGSWTEFSVSETGGVLGLGQSGTATQMFSIDGDRLRKGDGKSGTYEGLRAALHSKRLLVQHSAIDAPAEIYIAEDAEHLAAARPITRFNQLFAERDHPQWKPYQWKAPDGKTVEGLLLFPPGKMDQRPLRMLTLIHGGPNDADENRFGAGWYSWAALAAANGWMVFQPNYRGSTGYGDEFLVDIMPHLVSRPGADILAGVDALVKDGIADPEHLAIGGYSYGGYMTNWLITQTGRFRSAVSGAGAVEHASNWGNDDTTFDDAWIMGGAPWQAADMYQKEAALFQFDKVRTPVHDVIGSDDIRVAASQGYLMERALDALNIPHSFLVFPGEGHSLGKNPWHGYIKVREELKWLERYDHEPAKGSE